MNDDPVFGPQLVGPIHPEDAAVFGVETEMRGRLVGKCTMCGHEYEGLFDLTEQRDHLESEHGLYLDRERL